MIHLSCNLFLHASGGGEHERERELRKDMRDKVREVFLQAAVSQLGCVSGLIKWRPSLLLSRLRETEGETALTETEEEKQH